METTIQLSNGETIACQSATAWGAEGYQYWYPDRTTGPGSYFSFDATPDALRDRLEEGVERQAEYDAAYAAFLATAPVDFVTTHRTAYGIPSDVGPMSAALQYHAGWWRYEGYGWTPYCPVEADRCVPVSA